MMPAPQPEDSRFTMSATSTPFPVDGLRMRIVISARNDAQTIERTLDALRQQSNFDGQPIAAGSFEVTVLATDCDDDTAAVARGYAERHPAFPMRVQEAPTPSERATAAGSWRNLFDDACARFETNGHEGIVASTDAHTIVAPDWIAATLAEFAGGADVVGGRIVLSAADLDRMDPELRTEHLLDTGYHLLLAELGARVDPCSCDPLPCHHQHILASLAIRSDVYRRASAMAAGASAPDGPALYDALERIDARVRHSPNVRATTGFPAVWADAPDGPQSGRPVLVEAVPRSLRRLQLRRELRGRWRYRHSHRELEQGTRMDTYAYFGAFLSDIHWEIERYLDEAVGNEPVALPIAIGELRAALTPYH